MAQPERLTSQDMISFGIRKRVCKACDRCRLKKSKCDGTAPCSRCRADNSICMFSGRKKSDNKVYPKGYAEALEQQQTQLVAGLQEMYNRLVTANAWTGVTLPETHGQPLTHDILAALDLLKIKSDRQDPQSYEEDLESRMPRMDSDCGSFKQRSDSPVTDFEHEQPIYTASSFYSPSTQSTPVNFVEDPMSCSPTEIPGSRPVPQHPSLSLQPEPTTLQKDPSMSRDSMLYSASWDYLDTNADILIQMDSVMLSSGLNIGFGMGDAAAFTSWDQANWNNPTSSNDVLALNQCAQQLVDSIARVPDAMNNYAFDMPQDMVDVEFARWIAVAS